MTGVKAGLAANNHENGAHHPKATLAAGGDPRGGKSIAPNVSGSAVVGPRGVCSFPLQARSHSWVKPDAGQIGHQFGQADLGQKLIAPQIHHERRSPGDLF
jgi:hypothetical protein